MKLAGEHHFDAPRDEVWNALLDPEVLASVMPGCQRLEKTGDDEYRGALNIKVGPVQGKFDGKVKLEDLDPPSSYTLRVDGKGAPGFVRATGDVRLEERDGGTTMVYATNAQVGGRIAGVGQRLIESSGKAIIKQSLEGLEGAIQARVGADSAEEAAAVIAEAAPTQGEFAARVAKEVADDLVPPTRRRNLLLALVAIGAILALYFLLS